MQYIRVPLQEYVATLFGEESVTPTNGIIDLTAHGLQGDSKTVLACASRLAEAAVHAQQMIDDGMPYDLFGFVTYGFRLSESLQASLRQTESLLLYVDANERTIVPYVKSLLRDAGLFETHIDSITPDPSAVTTNQEERIYEQAGLVLKV